MPRVLIFKETILPFSETFVLAQARALRRYQWLLAGLEPARPSLPVEEPLLLTAQEGRVAEIRAKLYRRTGLAPLFHHRVRRFAPGLIHAHFASAGRTLIPLVRELAVPLIVTLHGGDITIRGAAKRYKELTNVAARFICVSEFIRERALEAGFPENKLVVHYIGIDRSLFVPSLDAASHGVVFVGRLVEKKGCEYLLRAMQLVQQSRPDVGLTIIGDGPLREKLEEMARELGVVCSFLGVLAPEQVKEQLRKAYAFCVPSVTASNGDSEGLGIVFAEAQAMGVPVVSNRHGGIAEVVLDGKTGLLVKERDHIALAGALERLLADSTLWQSFRQVSMQHVEACFDLYTQTARLEEIYDQTLAER
jgi:colanic acid/amylovoran biosynthesis glycosyltransferase